MWTRKICKTIFVALVGATLLFAPSESDARGRGGRGGRGGYGGYGGYSGYGRGYGGYGGYGGFGYGGLGYGGLGYGGLGFGGLGYGGLGYGGYGGGYGGYGGNYYGNGGYYNPGYGYSSPYYGNYYGYSGAPTVPYQSSYPPNYAFQPSTTSAILTVNVPDPNAEVWLQNTRMPEQGTVRRFEASQLDPNSNYAYTVRARWMENGKMMDQTRKVPVHAGQSADVNFTSTSQ